MGSFFSNDVDMPAQKSYGDSYKEGVQALVGALPQMYSADSYYTGLFNELFRNAQSENLEQYNRDLWDLQMEALDKYAPQLAQAQLEYEKEYAPQFLEMQLENRRKADPTYWAVRDALGGQINEDLEKGNTLSEAQTRQVDQNSRAAMAARGGSSAGYAPAAQEVLGEFLAGEGLKTSRQNAAQNFLNLGANGYSANSYGGAAPYSGVYTQGYSTLSPYMYSNAMAAGQNAANYNQQMYNQQMQWAQNERNQPSLFSSLFGTVTGGIGAGALASQAWG